MHSFPDQIVSIMQLETPETTPLIYGKKYDVV